MAIAPVSYTHLDVYKRQVIAKRNRGLNSAFTVRKISSGEGVERTFQTPVSYTHLDVYKRQMLGWSWGMGRSSSPRRQAERKVVCSCCQSPTSGGAASK